MSVLLELLGRAISIDTADLIWHWLNEHRSAAAETNPQYLHLSNIIDLMGDMKLPQAEEQLRLYLFENPSCTQGRMAAAAICLRKNKLSEAVEELNSVYMRQPNNTMALYTLGYCYERLGKEAQAVEFYQDCLKFKNYLKPPAQRLAAIYFKNGQLEKTVQQYELLKQQYPDDISTLVTLGYLYCANKDYTRAIETFNTAILIHPDNFLIRDDYLEQLISDGLLQEALERLENLLDEQPDRADLIAKQADVLSMFGETADAISLYQQALRICPEFLEATVKLGAQYLKLDAKQSAAQQFNRAVEINDKIVDAYIGLAVSEQSAGYHSKVDTTLCLAAAIQPNSSFLFSEAARLLFETTKHLPSDCIEHIIDTRQAVIDSHVREINRRPQNADALYRLGILLMSSGSLSDAAKAFRSVLDINPLYIRAKIKLSICLFEIGQRSDCLEQIAQLTHFDKEVLQLHYSVGLLFCDKLRFASSLFNLHQHMLKNFSCEDTAVQVSIALQNLGLIDRVSAIWENLTEVATSTLHES
jgi:tetratricopeptide (TPR) repeat protein